MMMFSPVLGVVMHWGMRLHEPRVAKEGKVWEPMDRDRFNWETGITGDEISIENPWLLFVKTDERLIVVEAARLEALNVLADPMWSEEGVDRVKVFSPNASFGSLDPGKLQLLHMPIRRLQETFDAGRLEPRPDETFLHANGKWRFFPGDDFIKEDETVYTALVRSDSGEILAWGTEGRPSKSRTRKSLKGFIGSEELRWISELRRD